MPDISQLQSATPAQDAQLRADVAQVQARLAELRAWSADRHDGQRLLALLSVAGGAEVHLPYTIPNLLRQAAAAGRGVDLVLGLNNGFACPELLDALQALPDVELLRLYSRRDLAAAAQPWHADPALSGAPVLLAELAPPRAHRIIVADPQARGDSSWKMRMLGEIVLGLLLPSIAAGWVAPQHTLVFDAESLFIAHADDRSILRELKQVQLLRQKLPDDPARLVKVILQAQPAQLAPAAPAPPLDWHGAGLEPMLALLETTPGLTFTGAITRFCVFDTPGAALDLPVALPNFAAACSPMHDIYHYTCGLLPGCECLPGGGTLGETLATLALLAVIATAHPSTICEDSMLTVLAQHAGMRMQLCDAVYLTNRCPPPSAQAAGPAARPAWLEQFVRWYAGFDAVEALYGRANAARVLGLDNEQFFSASLALFLKRLKRTGDEQQSLDFLDAVLTSGRDYQQIRALARAEAAS